MTHEEIIAMAKEAGFDMSRLPSICAANVYGEVNDELARFAALVAEKAEARANERANASWKLMCEKMVAAERESCAQLVQDKQELDPYAGINGWVAADAIRARGTKEGA